MSRISTFYAEFTDLLIVGGVVPKLGEVLGGIKYHCYRKC